MYALKSISKIQINMLHVLTMLMLQLYLNFIFKDVYIKLFDKNDLVQNVDIEKFNMES